MVSPNVQHPTVSEPVVSTAVSPNTASVMADDSILHGLWSLHPSSCSLSSLPGSNSSVWIHHSPRWMGGAHGVSPSQMVPGEGGAIDSFLPDDGTADMRIHVNALEQCKSHRENTLTGVEDVTFNLRKGPLVGLLKLSKRTIFLAFILISLSLLLVMRQSSLSIENFAEKVREVVPEEYNHICVPLFMATHIVIILAVMPTTFIEIIGTILLRWNIIPTIVVSKTIACIVTHYVVTSVRPVRRLAGSLVETHYTISVFRQVLSDSPLQYSILLRWCWIPAGIKNYGIPLFGVSLYINLLSLYCGCIPMTALHCVLLIQAGDILTDTTRENISLLLGLKRVVQLGAMIATMVTPLILGRTLRKRLRNERIGQSLPSPNAKSITES